MMKIGIFSKLGHAGGSEMRAAELSSIIIKSGHECYLLCENGLNELVRSRLLPEVKVFTDVLGEKGTNLLKLYEVDTLLIINTDSQSFTTLDYWQGKTEHHKFEVDIHRIKQMVFLFNYGIAQAATLNTIRTRCRDVRIICSNRNYFNLITERQLFEPVRHFPRIILDSPIGPIISDKNYSPKVRIGKHSKTMGYKFNSDHKTLINAINYRFQDQITWDFMGVPKDRVAELSDIPNVIIRKEFSIDVPDYLKDIDIFLFFIDYNRSEPWSRAVAEGMAAGCPVLATKKGGNNDQIIHGNNGYLCESLDDFYNYLAYLLENPEKVRQLGANAKICSKQYAPDVVFRKLLDFIAS
jgi:glycosyltransferase involved in cell wall biosynthesis